MNSGDEQHRLIIFDMDRTLIDISHVYVKAYRVAVREVYGIEGEPDFQRAPGHTQSNIIRMICRDRGVSDESIEAGLAQALAVLSSTTISLLDDDLRSGILPGAEQLLQALTCRGHALILVTGTVREITTVVLSRTGLDRFFPVCVCGDEADRRVELVQLAVRRARVLFGLDAAPGNLVVVGDAPRDIEAGKAVGARAVGVATGHHNADVLAACEADVVLPDFRDAQTAVAAVLGER